MKFIDEVQIVVISGKGGQGCVAFRRETYVPRGGPNGGDGGRGGDVIFKVNPSLNSLVDFRRNKKYIASSGQQGGGSQMHGSDGADLILEVPRGTLIKNQNTGDLVADLTDMDVFTVCRGGRGGKGNEFFKNSVNQAPDYAQPGEPGEELEVTLELKLIADVGIIGFPNAGKSTLISRISAAKPKIADYPFTTLTPNLGVVRVDESKSFVVADIPGLVQGAHAGVGLGMQFLKHIQRTKVFVHLVDGSGFSGRDPVQDYLDINEELEKYDETSTVDSVFAPLRDRQQIVAINKTDTLSSEEIENLGKKFKSKFGFKPQFISAVAGRGLDDLLKEIGTVVFSQEAP